MELDNFENIKNIINCPNSNEDGTIKLYRCISNPLTKQSFIPYGFKPKFKNNCEAWGLSTYNNKSSAKNKLKSLSKRLSNDYNAIAVAVISNQDGVKCQTGNDKNHYTYFPFKNVNLIEKFIIINESEE